MSYDKPTLDEAAEELGLTIPRSRMVRCPQHVDNTPSLRLYDDSFFCFSCGKSGDSIGLIAWFTNQAPRDIIKRRSNYTGHGGRIATKGLSRQDVTAAVREQYAALHHWWFRKLADAYEDTPDWLYLRAIDLWSEVFDDLTDQIKGHNGYDEPLTPAEAEAAISKLGEDLPEALKSCRAEAARYRMSRAADHYV